MKGTLISTKTFRYFTIGNPEKATVLIYVLHGYGQMPEYFIRKFSKLSDNYLIVAPEGMHRFYLNGSSGRVGASWMTKEERESDILDTLNFLNTLNQKFEGNNQIKRKIVFGFSQGGATAARWFYSNKIIADQLILWATVFPPDISPLFHVEKSNGKQNLFVIGDKDEFYNSNQQLELIKFYEENNFKVMQFSGSHDIEPITLLKIFNE